MLEFRGPEVQVGGTRLETYPKAADSRTRGRGAAKESRIPPRLVRGEWLKPFLHLSVLKDQLGLVSDSSTISHTHAHTHTRARARAPAPGELEFAEPEGLLALGNPEPAPGGTESTRGRVVWRKPPAPASGSRGTPRVPQPQRPPDPPRQLLQVSTPSRASRFSAASPEPPVHAVTPPPVVPPPPPPRPPPSRAPHPASCRHASGERPRRPHPRRQPAGLAGARRRLPLMQSRRQEPLGGSRAVLLYYSLGWPRRFLESPRRRREVFARRLLVRQSQLLGNWECCGGSGAHFSVVSLWGIGSFAGSSQERAAPRAREGASQSRRVRRAARLTAEAGGLAGKERRRGGWASRAEQSSFPRRPANPAGPLPPRRWLRRARESPAPRTAHRVAAAFHHCSFASPPAPTFPSLDSRAYTHTHTHTHTHSHSHSLSLPPPSTPAPLPRVVWR